MGLSRLSTLILLPLTAVVISCDSGDPDAGTAMIDTTSGPAPDVRDDSSHTVKAGGLEVPHGVGMVQEAPGIFRIENCPPDNALVYEARGSVLKIISITSPSPGCEPITVEAKDEYGLISLEGTMECDTWRVEFSSEAGELESGTVVHDDVTWIWALWNAENNIVLTPTATITVPEEEMDTSAINYPPISTLTAPASLP